MLKMPLNTKQPNKLSGWDGNRGLAENNGSLRLVTCRLIAKDQLLNPTLVQWEVLNTVQVVNIILLM